MKKLAFLVTNIIALAPKAIGFVLDLIVSVGNAAIAVLEDIVGAAQDLGDYFDRAFGGK